ncbi:RdgB/HAM1 family non-canonical purine NTP pyrophosphatase [Rothia sp. ZJ932]|uniref:RdgB/HAM1 family non-canonical purine NTP pyrophosphatase n=1 Tax=Rothia sp. ZJ932 TaxID=2810516 RepID=UPI0019673B0C|nr:RdgB/HAM1 family non-canonical purine NTP pyrophosphatase [Rothia sp. ZJ932]QRZ62297.1 RdgB/HAM1 family non-canonical purine NTP pyrophosphatase [Rothia sp. ZJ932]
MGAKVVLATHNAGKLRELREILRGRIEGLDVDTDVVSAADVSLPDVVEDGVTFAENSLLKARAAASESGLIAIADDSGLAVDVLGGAPGIFSARWAGQHGDDTANLNLLLAQLADIAEEHRGARFMCAASLATPEGETAVEHGELPGILLREPRGEGGFGYDPILAPTELTGELAGKSCAEIGAEVKNSMSHRARAFTALIPHLQKALAVK